MKINQAELDSKKQILDNAKKELKAYFIGIDHIIDDLMDYIQIWYLIPELLSRPVIVNLWGMTAILLETFKNSVLLWQDNPSPHKSRIFTATVVERRQD